MRQNTINCQKVTPSTLDVKMDGKHASNIYIYIYIYIVFLFKIPHLFFKKSNFFFIKKIAKLK
jgi:hypothetical protein